MDHCLEPRRRRLEDLKKIQELTVRGADPGKHRTHGGLYDQQQDQAVRDKYCEREAAWSWCRSLDEAFAGDGYRQQTGMSRPRLMQDRAADCPHAVKLSAAGVTNRCLSSATACLYGLSEVKILGPLLVDGSQWPADSRAARMASAIPPASDRAFLGHTGSFGPSSEELHFN